MLITAELRWFARGTLPTSIQDWFEQDKLGEHIAPSAAREDIYLYAPESEFVGIKLRQGRLEIKWRQAELGILHFGERVAGKAEKWGKWLCEDPSNASFQLSDVAGKKAWVSVKKVRTQRRYQVNAESAIAIPIDASSDQSCNVEITQLNVNNDNWWSLALEASDVNTLQAVADWIFLTHPELKLQIEDSYAYPHWLSLVK